jgi:TolA-binding protein
MKFLSIKAAVLWAAALPVFAQVEVVDRPISRGGESTQTPSSSPSQPVYPAPVSNPVVTQDSIEQPLDGPPAVPMNSGQQNNAAELYYQLQILQQEVAQLRGLVEEQAHQIKQLKQQRLDDYVDLDRRISQLGGASVPSSGSVNGAVTDNSSSSGSSPAVSPQADELASYKAAFNLGVREKNYDAAITALEKHLVDFPNGEYASNAIYWLGEVHLAKGQLDDAKLWFDRLLLEYPLSAKSGDAKYKLGIVYHMLGSNIQARSLLEEVSRTKGNAAKLAQNYLRDNFQ